MDYSLILSAISRYVSLDSEEQREFTSALGLKKFAAREVILREGEVCKYSAFVVRGTLRSYTIDKHGVEHILSFAPKGWWIADMYSLLSRKPGVLTIEAMDDSEAFVLAKKDQEQLYLKIPKLERFFRILTENSLIASQQRLIDNLSLTAQERYLKFCNTYPGLIDKVPQKLVAAYIGVTPEFLSKMKKKIGH